MKFKSLQMPKLAEIDPATATDTYGEFTVEPLERGFGTTLGNALRRVLLSSIQGAAITNVKIDGALHELAEIIINLKKLRFTFLADDPQTLTLEADKAGDVQAGSFTGGTGVTILNPDVLIATLDKGAKLRIEI